MQEPLKQQQEKLQLQINPKYIKYGIIYFSVVFIITAFLIGIAINKLLSYPNIYAGVTIGNIDVGGHTKESAVKKLMDEYSNKLEKRELTLKSKDKSIHFYCKDIDAYYDMEDAVSKGYNVGRTGGIFKKLNEIYKAKTKHIEIPLHIKADQAKLESKIKELSAQVDIPVEEYSTRIENNMLYVKEGSNGEIIIINKAVEKVMEALNYSGSDIIELTPEIVQPKPVEVNDLYNKVCMEPANARFEVKNYHINIIPHIVGISFDKEEADRIIRENRGIHQEYAIPIQLTMPERTTDQLKQILFKDKLAQYTTWFNEREVERTTNVSLAARKINNIVLGPGDIFSYNEVVGSRTPEAGFQNAKVFVGGNIVDGLGGGICQVSSTLYNAILYADLEVVSRSNHSLPVTYVPLGQDATVVDGLIDFKFKNNTEWPIKIISKMSGGKLTFELFGVKSENDKMVIIENQTIQMTPFSTKYIDDPNMDEGQTIVKQKGSNGYVIDTYKIIKRNGNIVERKKISRSTYLPIEEQIIRGTRKVVPALPEVKGEATNVVEQQSQQFQQSEQPVPTDMHQQSEPPVQPSSAGGPPIESNQ